MDLTTAIGWGCMILGAACIISGIVIALNNRKQTPPTPPQPGVGEHGAIKDVIESTSNFAKALKDLDLSGKLLTVGVLLIAIAAVSAGLDNVANAIESAAKN